MAYAAATVATDPSTLAQTNTALTATNVFVANLYADARAILATVRENVRLRQGNPLVLQQLDSLGPLFAPPSDPAVSTDPVTKADADTIFATHIANIAVFLSRFQAAAQIIAQVITLTGGVNERILADLNAAFTAFATAPSSVTTAGSDPVSAADMNTALAAAAARVDTVNGRFAPIVDVLLEKFRLSGGNPLAMAAIQNSANAIRAH